MAITPFFAWFYVLQGETTYPSKISQTSTEKIGKSLKKKKFGQKFIRIFLSTFPGRLRRNFLGTKWIFHFQAAFRFLNWPVVFDIEPKNHFLTYLVETALLAKRSGRLLPDFDNLRIGTICGQILGYLAPVVPEILAFEKHYGWAGSPTKSFVNINMFVNTTLYALLRSW